MPIKNSQQSSTASHESPSIIHNPLALMSPPPSPRTTLYDPLAKPFPAPLNPSKTSEYWFERERERAIFGSSGCLL